MGDRAFFLRGAIVLGRPGFFVSRWLILPFVVGISALAACADKPGGPIAYNVPLAAPDTPTVVPLESDYKIAPMDTVSVKVFKAPDLSGDYEVDLTGHISLPLVGEVEAANLTTAQLDQRLTETLGRKYFEHPDVSVGVKASTKRAVTVDGAVKQAGSFPVAGSTSLMQAVALGEVAVAQPDVARRHLEPPQVLADGGHYERAPAYHCQVLADLDDVARHEIVDRQFLRAVHPGAQHGGGRRHHRLQFFSCLVGSKLLPEPQQGAQKDHRDEDDYGPE